MERTERKKNGFLSFFRLSKRSSRSKPDLKQGAGGDVARDGITPAGQERGSPDRSRASRAGSSLRKSRSQSHLPGPGKKSAVRPAAELEPEWIPFSRTNKTLCKSSEDVLETTTSSYKEDVRLSKDADDSVAKEGCPVTMRATPGKRVSLMEPSCRHSVIGTCQETAAVNNGYNKVSLLSADNGGASPGYKRQGGQTLRATSPGPSPSPDRGSNMQNGGRLHKEGRSVNMSPSRPVKCPDTRDNVRGSGRGRSLSPRGSRADVTPGNSINTPPVKSSTDITDSRTNDLINGVKKVNGAASISNVIGVKQGPNQEELTSKIDSALVPSDYDKERKTGNVAMNGGDSATPNCVKQTTITADVTKLPPKNSEPLPVVSGTGGKQTTSNLSDTTGDKGQTNKMGSQSDLCGPNNGRNRLVKPKTAATSALGMKRILGGSKNDVTNGPESDSIALKSGLFTQQSVRAGSQRPGHNKVSVTGVRDAGVDIKPVTGTPPVTMVTLSVTPSVEDVTQEDSPVYSEISEVLSPRPPRARSPPKLPSPRKTNTRLSEGAASAHVRKLGLEDNKNSVDDSTKSRSPIGSYDTDTRCNNTELASHQPGSFLHLPAEVPGATRAGNVQTGSDSVTKRAAPEVATPVTLDSSVSPVMFNRHAYSHGSHDSGFYQSTGKPKHVTDTDAGSTATMVTVTEDSTTGDVYYPHNAGRWSQSPRRAGDPLPAPLSPRADSFGSLLSCSSTEDEEEFYEKPVVRKSRSYHDLRRLRAKSRSGQLSQVPGEKSRSHDMLLDRVEAEMSSDEESRLQLLPGDRLHHREHKRGRKLKNLTSENESVCLHHQTSADFQHQHLMVRDYPVTMATGEVTMVTDSKKDVRRAESADNLLRRRRRARLSDHGLDQGSKDLYHRSQSVGQDINLKPRGRASHLKVKEVRANETPIEVKGDIGNMAIKHQMSMAASAAYIPGVSLSDKLRLAASKGQVDKVRELLGAGATFEPDREGRTAVHYAALNGYADIVKYLSDDGCDIDAQDKLGYTALHRAAAQGHLEVIKVLLTEACQIDKQDEVHGDSALHEAAWNGYSKTLELLVKHKANVMVVNKAGFSALHLAAQNGHNQSARVLLYAGCNSSHKNNYGDTAMHTAARYGHAGVTRILISARAKLIDTNKNGDTALHIAAALKRRKIAKLLVESGISVNVKNKQNETAADVGRRKDHIEIVDIILTLSKNAKKKKNLGGKGKKSQSGMTLATEDEEKKEKKSFFFGKKKKNKDKDKDKDKEAPPVVPPVQPFPSAPSEISSSDFTSHMTPEDILRGFRQHRSHSNNRREGRATQRESSSEARSQARGTSTGSRSVSRHDHRDHKEQRDRDKVVKGVLSKYAPQEGMQYYKDLAGNIKQGPIGYAPVCNCGPTLKKIEKQLEADRCNIYDHIDASHRTLADRIEVVDKRSAQQAFAIERMTTDRLDKDRHDRDEYVRKFLEAEQAELDRRMRTRHNHLQFDLQSWVDDRLSTFESRYVREGSQEAPQLRYHRDDMLTSHPLLRDDAPPPGKLWKSRSDETLSVSSSHPSRSRSRHKMSRARAQKESADLKLSTYADRAHRLERKIRAYNAKREQQARDDRSKSRDTLHVHDVQMSRQRPLTYHEGQGQMEGRQRSGHEEQTQNYPNMNGLNSLPRNFREEGKSRRREASPAEWRRPPSQPPMVNGYHGNQARDYRSSSVEARGQPDPPLRVRNGSVEPPPRSSSIGARNNLNQGNGNHGNNGQYGNHGNSEQYNTNHHGNNGQTNGGYYNNNGQYNYGNSGHYSGNQGNSGNIQQLPNGNSGQYNVRGYQNGNHGNRGEYKPVNTNNNYLPAQGSETPTRAPGPQTPKPFPPPRAMSGSKSMEFNTPRSEGGYTFDSTPSPSGPHQSTPAQASPSGYPGNSTPYHHNTPSTTPLTTSPQDYTPSSGGFPSPASPSSPGTFQVEAQIHHSKTDSGSNPDSGYSSRIYRLHGQTSGKLTNSTVSSSYNSSPDSHLPHNSSRAAADTMATIPDAMEQQQQFQQQPRTTPEEGYKRRSGGFNPVSDVLNAWYQQKMYEGRRGPPQQGAPAVPPRTYNPGLNQPAPQPHRVEIGRATQV